MDPSSYKDFTTTRGLNYHYYFSPPASSDKPILLFLHGFPSTSFDWRHQVRFFKEHGYGLVVPDLLGYGGTDKPANPKDYASSLICKDIIDILDAEHIDEAIAIGHDWGCKPVSRLANLHSDRFRAFGFLALGYLAPPALDPEVLAQIPKIVGRELYGYWAFFSDPDADKAIESKVDSFFDLCFAQDKSFVVKHIAPTNGLKKWLEADNRTTVDSFISKDEMEWQKESFKRGGFTGPLNWYKVVTSGLELKDTNTTIPQSNYEIHKPVLFGAALKDDICDPDFNRDATKKFCSNVTVKELNAGHWVMLEARDELNEGLLEWVEGL